VQKKRDWNQGWVFDDQRQFVAEIIPIGGGVAPGVVLIYQAGFPVTFLENVETQGDCRPVNGVDLPGAPAGLPVPGPEQRVDHHDKQVFGAAAERPVHHVG